MMQWWRDISGIRQRDVRTFASDHHAGFRQFVAGAFAGAGNDQHHVVRGGKFCAVVVQQEIAAGSGESPRAKEGSGGSTMVALGLRLVSTIVFMPHLAQ